MPIIAYRPLANGRDGAMQIGIAGVGKMGDAIARRLMEAGHTLTIWNRSADKLKSLINGIKPPEV